MKLDEKDRKMISLMSLQPDISQESMAQEIGISQPSVAMRMKKLRESGAIQSITGINPFSMGLFTAKVDISTSRPAEVMDTFRNCPYFAHGFTISGRYNLCLLFMSENISTLEAIVNGHIRSHEWVNEVEFNIIISSEKDMVVPTVLRSGTEERPPCGMSGECLDCQSFKEGKCMGCPATGQYQGWLY